MAKRNQGLKGKVHKLKRSNQAGNSTSKTNARSLSTQQAKVLSFLKDSFYASGSMPTLREICHFMGWSAVGSAQSITQTLVEKGYLRRDPQKARGLQLADSDSFRLVPLLGSAPAGDPIEAVEHHDGDLQVPGFIRGPVFAIRVRGESMINAGIEDDDIVIVKQSSSADHGDVIVAMLDGEVTIKRFMKKGRGLILHPENEAFEDIKIEDSSFRVLGKVIGLHRYWESF